MDKQNPQVRTVNPATVTAGIYHATLYLVVGIVCHRKYFKAKI